jgi:hypothetical protein
MKSAKKITTSELRRRAEDMIAAGTMPSLETVLEAVAESRAKHRDRIVQARREHEARQNRLATPETQK